MARNLERPAIVVGGVQAAKRRLENMDFRFLTPLRCVRNDRSRGCAKISRQMLELRKGLTTDVGVAQRSRDRCWGYAKVSSREKGLLVGVRVRVWLVGRLADLPYDAGRRGWGCVVMTGVGLGLGAWLGGLGGCRLER